MHFYKTSCVQLIMESVLSGLFAFAAPEIQDYFQFKTLFASTLHRYNSNFHPPPARQGI